MPLTGILPVNQRFFPLTGNLPVSEEFPNYIIQKRLPTRDKDKQSLAKTLLELSRRSS